MKYVPVLDKGFRPMYAEFTKYSEEAAKTENKLLKICVERNDGYNYIYEYKIFANGHKDENNLMAERIVNPRDGLPRFLVISMIRLPMFYPLYGHMSFR